MKIRILHVAQSAGGVDRYLRMLLKYLDKDFFENIVVLSQDFREDDYKGLAIEYVTVKMQRAIGKEDKKSIIEVRKQIKKYQPDIVYAHSSKAGAISRIANIGLKSRCVYNPHGWAFNMNVSANKQRTYMIIEKLLAMYCDKIVCISESERESALKDQICKADKLELIYNGIDIEAYESSANQSIKRADIGIPEDAFVVGMVGRISEQKAPDIFIRAAKKIKINLPTAYFVIVGSGEMEPEIRKYARDNGLADSLHITGWVENSINYIELFDVACLLSRWEGFGLVLPEYMMAGKPIVASNVDAIPNILQNEYNGILVDVENIDETCSAIMRLHDDEKLRNELVRNGKEELRRFDVKRVCREHEALFRDVLERK